jgi:hypothetical protein
VSLRADLIEFTIRVKFASPVQIDDLLIKVEVGERVGGQQAHALLEKLPHLVFVYSYVLRIFSIFSRLSLLDALRNNKAFLSIEPFKSRLYLLVYLLIGNCLHHILA